MSDRQNWFRFVASIFALTVVSAFAIAAIGPNYYPSMFATTAASQEPVTERADAEAPPVTIGTCDTAGPIEVESSGGTTTPTAYGTLKLAFDAVIAGTHTDSINIEVCGNTTETATAAVTASGLGATSYTDITIRPVGGARIIEGTITGAIIRLTGADNVTIDGRQGGAGTARDLTVRNNSTAAATAAIYLSSVAAGNGASNNVIRNLEVAAGQTANTGTSATFGIIQTGTAISVTSADGNDNDNNQFIFNRVVRARYGIVSRGVTTNNNLNAVVTDNIVGPTSFGPDEIGKAGIYMQADTGALVSRNVVQFVGGTLATTTAGTDRCGICIGNENWGQTEATTITSGDYTVTRNTVHDVVEERTFSAVGIRLGTTRSGVATNNLIANNFIYNIRSNGTAGDQACGIGYAAGHTDRIVFNSISMTGDMDPTGATATTIYGNGMRVSTVNATNNANLTLMNNSVYLDVNANTAANHYYAITLPAAAYVFGTGGLNHNNYYINAANTQLRTGGLGVTSGNTPGTEFQTLANWQSALTTPQDANSIQADPLYFSFASDLHIQQASPNVNAGLTIAGIADDFDAQVRPNGANPDIGADEFYPAPGSVQLDSTSYSAAETAGMMTITVTRSGGANGAGSVDYATGGGTATGGAACGAGVDYVTTNGTLMWADLDVAPKSFNVPICADGVFEATESFDVTLSNAVTVSLGSPSVATATLFDAGSTFNGPVNVGTGETVTSLTNAGGLFAGINNGIVSGNITINITSDLAGETGAVALNEIAGGFTVLVKPSGVARTVTGSSSSYMIPFLGTDMVTIDGSLSGGTDRSLTITNSGSGGSIGFTTGANGAQNNTVKNVNIWGGSPTATIIGVAFGGNAFGTAGADNDNNRVENCDVRSSIYGIYSVGVSSANPNTGVVITRNVMTGSGAARVGRIGIFTGNDDGVQITQNSFANFVNGEGADVIAIAAGSQSLGSTAPATVSQINAVISRNSIVGLQQTNTFSAAGIVVGSGTAGTNRVENNMVSGVIANSNAGDIVVGIYVIPGAGATQNIYHNSVSMTGDRGSATANMLPSYALAISADQPVNVVNNVLFNSQTRTGSTGGGGESYAFGFDGPAANVNLTSNYNDLFVSGPIGVIGITGDLTTAAQTTTAGTGTNRVTLADWQTAKTEDANSISADPLFTSLTDLHIPMGSPVVNVGNTGTGVTVDFDGQTRDATPDIGADEFIVAAPGTLAFSSATYNVGEAGPMVTLTVNRTGGTDGAVSVDYALGGGTATGGAACGGPVDYVNAGGTLNFANGEASKTFDVPICTDVVFEGNETFDATLSNATGGATIGTPNPATVTITDDEVQPTVQFSSPTYMITEGLANNGVNPAATITVTLSGPSQGAASVDYATVAGGTATGGASCTAGIDFINTSGTLNFVAGDVSETFQVTTCADADDEADETVNLALSNPVGTTLGTPNTAVLTITDNDVPAGGPVTVTATAGTPGPTNYPTLKDAIDAINGGTHQGDITVAIVTSTTETATSVLNGSGAGSALYTSIVIRPVSDGVTVAGPSLQGRGLLELNGADNVTIDGDNPGTGGTNRNLTFQNTAASTTTFTSVIRIALAATVTNSADNNVIRNLNIVGSATGRNIATATSTTASENTTFGVFAGPGASTVASTNPPAAITSVITGVGAGATATNLVVSNNSYATAARGVSINGSANTVFPGLQITNNLVGNATAGDVNQVTAMGIVASGSTSAVISGNTVYVEGYVPASASTHGIDVGINSTAITGATIEKNRVNRVENNNPGTWSAIGINLGGGSDHVVRNNFVSGVMNDQVAGTGGFGTTFGAYGIRIGSGTGHDVYHNSVHLYGALGGTVSTNLTAAFMMTATTQTGADVRNNIFSNQITGGNPATPGTRHVAIYLPAAATVAMNLTLNNNGYYQGTDPLSRMAQVGATFGAGEYLAENFDPTATTPASNFRAYTSPLSAAGTNDNASFASVAPPPFVSNTDLHIPAGTATRLESGGAAVGVVDDIDAEMRNATTPDIGADEFAGNPPPANDIAAAAILVPVPNSTILVGSSVSPQARFRNDGSATQMNVSVQFNITGPGGYNYTDMQVIPTINPSQQVVVTFAAAPAFTMAGMYNMTATVLTVDSNPANNQIAGTFQVRPPLTGGTYTVGTGGNYTSLTNPGGIFADINLVGASGNIVIDIISDLTAETGAVGLNQVAGGFSVTIKPSGAARVISGTAPANTGLINLNGADNVTIDGSLSGGSDRSLTITNNQTGLSTVIWIKSIGSNGSTGNTVKNCIINGAPGANATTTAGVLTGSGVTLGNDAEAPNSNNTIQNNFIHRVQNSLYLRGGAAANADVNWVVTGNELGSNTAGNRNSFRGMLIGNSQNFTVTNNLVHGVQSSTTTAVIMSGIQVALVVNGGMVTNNVIHEIKNVSATGTGAYGISFISTSTASNVTVANNFIYDVTALGSATLTSNGYGINVASGGGYKIYFNSVNLNVNQGSGTTAAMFVNAAVTTAGALDIRNNIFANTQTAGATRYAFYSAAANTVYTPIDYNDYFSTGSVGFLGGARATLADWQTATGQDVNSKAVDPLFVSPTDLHLQAGSPMLASAVAGTGITTDIDGQTRDVVPDIGADEIPSGAMPGALQFSSATYAVGEAGPTATITVNRVGGSDGTVTVDYATVAGGTATGGAACTAGIDYVTISPTTLTFLNGETSKTFNVTICEDATVEMAETINLALSNPTGGGTLGTPNTAVLTINDNDSPTPFSVAIGDARVFEGNAGTANLTFSITLTANAPLSDNIGGTIASVNFATADGTATVAGGDYAANSGTINFTSPGTQMRTVIVNGDTVKESNEFLFVNLSMASANTTITDGQGAGIIVDEDRPYTADFDRDIKSDYSIFRPSTTFWYALQSASGTPLINSAGPSGDVAVPGDYDGDGKTDIAVFQTSSANWFILRSSDSGITTAGWGVAGDKAVQGDYDGDGKTDLAIFRPSTATWWILRSSTGTSTAVTFGLSTDKLMQGDYDGDFKTDVAVYRDGTWYIFRSSDSQVQISNWGNATDKPVSGDFDGDGRNDLAIYRSGTWWILNSLSGNSNVVPFGLATDVPAPADYDGDGTTDRAVFRGSAGDWYVLQSSNGAVTGVNWGVSTDVPIPSAYIPQ